VGFCCLGTYQFFERNLILESVKESICFQLKSKVVINGNFIISTSLHKFHEDAQSGTLSLNE